MPLLAPEMPVVGDSMDLLHCARYDRAMTHSKIIITTPHIHFIFCICHMCNRELGCEMVNIVEIPVALIFVFLLQSLGVEYCIVKMDWMGVCSMMVGWSGSVGVWLSEYDPAYQTLHFSDALHIGLCMLHNSALPPASVPLHMLPLLVCLFVCFPIHIVSIN